MTHEPAPLSEVIPRVRVDPELIDALRAAWGVERARRKGSRFSLSDLVREIVWEWLTRHGYATGRAA